jgi:MFS family permease
LWHNRNFLLLWTGQTVSTLGARITEVALPLLVLAITHSPVQAGLAGFVAGLPKVVFQLPAGAWVDRWDRRQIMIGCDLGRLLVIASIPLVGVTIGISYPQLVATCFIHSTLSVLFVLAERAALPQVVGSDKLPVAVAQNQATMQGAVTVGAPVAGVLYGLSHLLPFVADAVSYVISLIALRHIRIPLPAAPPANVDRLLHDIAVGVRFVWSDRCLRALSLISAALSPVVAGLPLVIMVLATHLGATSSQIGAILGFGGIGGLLGSAFAPYLVRTVAAGALNLAGLWLWAASVTSGWCGGADGAGGSVRPIAGGFRCRTAGSGARRWLRRPFLIAELFGVGGDGQERCGEHG